jgi:hypothetical protein
MPFFTRSALFGSSLCTTVESRGSSTATMCRTSWWYPFLLSVHDELVLECPKEDARGVALWLKAKMREAMEEILGEELGGLKRAEVGYGPSWGECVELEMVVQQYK